MDPTLDPTVTDGVGTTQDPTPAAAPKAGLRLGAWVLIERIGSGGMGEVWLAQRCDGLYEARAAVKLLRADITGPGLGARFARERALLGRLDHAGIARLLDAGLAGETAYLVLEHVPGLTLSQHVARRRASVAERVRLLIGVARAVEYAHAQLIVHRDLKPGNVMVTPAGAPKLLDFGIAALLDDATGAPRDSALTRLAGRRHTPAYAAPEQLLGEVVGTAADQYALGVMLFELLSGELPYADRAASPQAMEHAVLHTEPMRLSRTRAGAARAEGPGLPPDHRLARGDLEAVAAKALRKRPAERYASVRAFIDDLEAWLAHRPVSVRGEDWRHRGRLWLRRNAGLAGAGALVLASLGAGLGLSLWQWQRADHAARVSQRALTYLGDLLANADPKEHGGRPPTVEDLLERSRRELDQRFDDEPELRAELQGVLVHVYHAQGRFDRAIELGERQLSQLRALHAADAIQVVEAQDKLARVYNAAGLVDRTLELATPLLQPTRRLMGEDSTEYSALLQMLVVGYTKTGRFAEAEALVPEMLAVNERATAPGSMPRMATLTKLAVLRYAQGRFTEAAATLEQARPAWVEGIRTDPVEVLAQQRGLLTMQMRRLLPRDFEREVRELTAEMDRLLGPDTETALGLRNELANWWQDRGEHAAAQREREAVKAAGAARGVTMGALLLPRETQLLLSRTLAGSAEPAQLAREARALAAALPAEPRLTGPNLADPLLHLARAALRLDPPLAAELARQIERLPILATSAPLRGRLQQLQGALARRGGDLAASRRLLEQRVAALDAINEPDQAPRWRAQLDLATTLMLQRDMPAANAALARADALRPRHLPRPHPLDAWRESLGRGEANAPPDAAF
ncbi:protein kinase [Roseateles sp. DAIF2]|uniref:serine/threonine-protein kinase n=1 Tax=Roseateles sp. DAIF2 TaxID=2714952 RepID=UPI0018A33615|nr:serine/threonine-protein kinase [Roseateles sp. DAIF2]QPF76192.1 protein kinase [Roseateles sp. DAIF2]